MSYRRDDRGYGGGDRGGYGGGDRGGYGGDRGGYGGDRGGYGGDRGGYGGDRGGDRGGYGDRGGDRGGYGDRRGGDRGGYGGGSDRFSSRSGGSGRSDRGDGDRVRLRMPTRLPSFQPTGGPYTYERTYPESGWDALPVTQGMSLDALKAKSVKQQTRIYVGGIGKGASKQAIRDCFNALVYNRGRITGPDMSVEPSNEPVAEITYQPTDTYAFISMATPDDATIALLLEGPTYEGRYLRIKRPNDYVPPSGGDPSLRH
ncbi:hypothetical protein KIPB_008624, partial [Kipferlia bialata]|eukprot:g8624.t1